MVSIPVSFTEEQLRIIADILWKALDDDAELDRLADEGVIGIEKLAENLSDSTRGLGDKNIPDGKKILELIRSQTIAYKSLVEDYIEFITGSVEENVISFIYRLIIIYYIFTDIMFFRSTLKWPDE